MEKCNHLEMQDGVCIECGYCDDDMIYVPEAYTEYRKISNLKKMKYTVKQEINTYKKSLNKILINLNLIEYEGRMLDMLKKVEIKYRVSPEDKILIILYYLLKKEGCPIVTSDLLKFSKLKKFKFLKLYRNTFGTNLNSIEYLKSIYDRVCSTWCNKGINTNILTFENFLECKSSYPTVEAYLLCLGCLIITSESPWRKLISNSKNQNEQLRKIILKIKQDFFLSEKNY